MRNNISRIKRLEEILTPKHKLSIILDYISPDEQSWIDINDRKYMIPPDADVEKFIEEKAKMIRGNAECSLYLTMDRTSKPNADFSSLISKADYVMTWKSCLKKNNENT